MHGYCTSRPGHGARASGVGWVSLGFRDCGALIKSTTPILERCMVLSQVFLLPNFSMRSYDERVSCNIMYGKGNNAAVRTMVYGVAS